MAVSVRRPSERVSNSALVQAYGLLAEHVAARKDVKDAILLVLGYEQDRIDRTPRTDLPADMAHAAACVAFGKQEGLDRAALVLLDGDHIRTERERLEELNKEIET